MGFVIFSNFSFAFTANLPTVKQKLFSVDEMKMAFPLSKA